MRWSGLAAVGGLSTVLLVGCGKHSHSSEDPAALLKKGAMMVASFSFFEGEAPLRQVREQSPVGSPAWQESSYLLALCLRHQSPIRAGRIAEARQILEELLEVSPDSPLAPDALMVLARIDELRDFPGDPPDAAAAASRYRLLMEKYRDSDLADLAFLRLAAQQTLDPANKEAARKAASMMEERMAARPDSPYRWAFWEYIAAIYLLLLEDKPAALRAMIEADNHSLQAEGRRGNNFWNIARLAEELGDWKTAERYYLRLKEKAPRNQRWTEAAERLEVLRTKQREGS